MNTCKVLLKIERFLGANDKQLQPPSATLGITREDELPGNETGPPQQFLSRPHSFENHCKKWMMAVLSVPGGTQGHALGWPMPELPALAWPCLGSAHS